MGTSADSGGVTVLLGVCGRAMMGGACGVDGGVVVLGSTTDMMTGSGDGGDGAGGATVFATVGLLLTLLVVRLVEVGSVVVVDMVEANTLDCTQI